MSINGVIAIDHENCSSSSQPDKTWQNVIYGKQAELASAHE